MILRCSHCGFVATYPGPSSRAIDLAHLDGWRAGQKAHGGAGGERTVYCPACVALPDLAERRRNQLAAEAAKGEGT